MKFSHPIRFAIRVLSALVLVSAIVFGGQFAAGQTSVQSESERNSLIEKAERGEYNVKLVEFCCLEKVRGRKLFRKMGSYISEGDIFTRAKLEKSLKALNKISEIHKLIAEDVTVKVDDERRVVNIIYRVREREK